MDKKPIDIHMNGFRKFLEAQNEYQNFLSRLQATKSMLDRRRKDNLGDVGGDQEHALGNEPMFRDMEGSSLPSDWSGFLGEPSKHGMPTKLMPQASRPKTKLGKALSDIFFRLDRLEKKVIFTR